MSSFTTPAILELLEHYRWRICRPFRFYIGDADSPSRIITVPVGYITDLASVPRVFWSLFPPHGNYAKAAIVHDYMYENAVGTKREADLAFYEGMRILGVPKWKAYIMYKAASVFGKGNYEVSGN